MEKEFDVNNLKTFCYQPFGCSPLRPLKKGKPHSLNVDHFSFDPKVIRSDVTCEYIRERCFLTLHTLFCICTHHLHKCINYLDKSNMDLEEVIFCKLGLYALLHHQMICYFLSVLGDKMRVYDPVNIHEEVLCSKSLTGESFRKNNSSQMFYWVLNMPP